MTDTTRRELNVRQKNWVKKFTAVLVKTNITPNQISIASFFAALVAAASFYFFSQSHNGVWLIIAPLCIQLRLLCNLFDGLVAVEGGKGSPSGELFNDIPDRLSDMIIFIGVGFATGSLLGLFLGIGAGVAAILTAYIRTLGESLGAPISFAGPMAKQHRMALITGASLLTLIEVSVNNTSWILMIAVVIAFVGSVFTCWRRARAIYDFLEEAPQEEGE